tara:strand:+ start:752 stop:1513 length:762 start_codon:yes stop_codon:yes gene_type:complete
MSTPGFILLSRDILDKPSLWGSPDVFRLWSYILLRCNFGEKSYSYSGVEVKRGQFLRSFRAIARDCSYKIKGRTIEWSPTKIQRMLGVLVRDGRIKIIPHDTPNVGTLIEVLNWDHRQSIKSFRKENKPEAPKPSEAPVQKRPDHSKELWDIWLSTFSLKSPHPTLTPKRAQVLNALFTEQLSKNGSDPLHLFRGICQALKASDFHAKKREFCYPESFLKSPERRDAWYLRSLEQKNTIQSGGVSLQWSIEDD